MTAKGSERRVKVFTTDKIRYHKSQSWKLWSDSSHKISWIKSDLTVTQEALAGHHIHTYQCLNRMIRDKCILYENIWMFCLI